MHKARHHREDVDRLYESRKEGGRGLASIEDNIDASIQRLEDYIEKHERRLITAIRNGTDYTIDERMTITRKQNGEKNNCMAALKTNKQHLTPENLDFTRDTESLLIAAQDNAIRTNHIKARIDKTQQNSKCRLCCDGDETINHMISECSKLDQKEYKMRHNWVGKVIHWEMCKKFKFDHTNKWYMHNPIPIPRK